MCIRHEFKTPMRIGLRRGEKWNDAIDRLRAENLVESQMNSLPDELPDISTIAWSWVRIRSSMNGEYIPLYKTTRNSL